MAKLYGEIAKSALLTLDKSFSRALGQPLDASEVYYSLTAAQEYAATPAAYVGQKIVVIENGKVTHYSVDDTVGTLKEVGVRPTGDGKSITVSAEGVVSILGMAGADSLTLPRMKEDKSGIEWVPVSQVVKGDGNDNTTYTFTELTKGEGDAAETYGFVVKTFFNGTEVEGGSIEIAFDVYTKSEADAKFLAKTDAYDDTELANRVKAVEDNKADKSTTYTKTEVDTAIDKAKKSILGEDVEEAYNTLKEIQDILQGTDGETIDGLIETVDANKTAIATLNGNATTVGSVAKQIADAVAPLATTEALNGVKATAEAAQTAEQVADAIEAAITEANLGQYATKGELEAHAEEAEASYAKKATTLAGYGITDAYTKNEVDAKIGTPGTPAVKDSEGNVTTEAVVGTGVFASTYSKAELNALLDEIEGGSTESAASVARQLDEYKTANNQRVADIEVAVGKDVNGEEPATGLFLEVDQARAQADRGVEDAAAAAQAVAQLAGGQVATNKQNIENLAALVGTIGDKDTATLAGKIGALEAHDAAHALEFGTLSGTVGQNTKDITTNKADINTINTVTIPALQAAIEAEEKARKAAIGAPSTPGVGQEGDENYVAPVAATGIYAAIEDVANTIDFTPYLTKVEAGNTYATITALNGVKSDLAILVGNDKTADGKPTMSVRDIVKAEVGSAGHLKREIVTELPAVEDADADTIYMVKGGTPASAIYTTDVRLNSQWELINDTYEQVAQDDSSLGCAIIHSGDEDEPNGLRPGVYYASIVSPNELDFKYALKEVIRVDVELSNGDIIPLDENGFFTLESDLPIAADVLLFNTEGEGQGAPELTLYRVNESTNVYKEYMLVNGAFEQIGDTSVNLDGYATEDWVTNLVNNSTPAKFEAGKLGTILGAVDTVVDDKTEITKNVVYAKADGTGEVKAISTDILVNGEFELVLNGGNATGKANA